MPLDDESSAPKTTEDPVTDEALQNTYRRWPLKYLQKFRVEFESARRYNDRRIRAIDQVLKEKGSA